MVTDCSSRLIFLWNAFSKQGFIVCTLSSVGGGGCFGCWSPLHIWTLLGNMLKIIKNFDPTVPSNYNLTTACTWTVIFVACANQPMQCNTDFNCRQSAIANTQRTCTHRWSRHAYSLHTMQLHCCQCICIVAHVRLHAEACSLSTRLATL